MRLPQRPLVPGEPTRPPALDPIPIRAPVGTVRPPADDHHVLDLHLGAPAYTICLLGGCTRREVQIQGMFTIVPAGAEGTWVMSKEVQALLLRLSPSLVRETAETLRLPSGSAELAPTINVRDPHIERLGLLVREERDEGFPSGRLYLDSLACAIAARLLATQVRGGRPPGSRGGLPGRRLRQVLEYVEAHLDRDLALEHLAAVAGFSPSHFKALFKRSTQMPVHRYVVERRVERARVLLLQGGRTLTEVALEAGFAHTSHMARCMRQVLGTSPRQLLRLSRD